MQTGTLVKSLAKHTEDLSKDLDSFSDRAFELCRLANELKERAGKTYVEKACQVETAAVGAPSYQLDRAKRLAPFAFTGFDRKINWRKLRALNVDKVVSDTDTRTLLEIYGELAYADLEAESVYDLSEANLLKVVRLLQLLLQFQQFQLEQGLGVQQLLREEQAEAVGLLRQIPRLQMKGLQDGLGKLQGDFYKVADADMDAMFQQVRTEERTGARDTVGHNVDQVKQALDPRVFGGGQGAGGAGADAASGTAGGGGTGGGGGAGGAFGTGASASAGQWPPAGTQMRSEIQLQRGSVPAGMMAPGLGAGGMSGMGGGAAGGVSASATPSFWTDGVGPGGPGGPPPPAVVRPAQSVSSLTSGVARLSVGQPGAGLGSYGAPR
ncbi:hypothetical protein HXX76_013473 [Chlamydomonas incerta]|uniref:Cilium assembly protein DZIP1 N-terminal domain-containing protein n=1 Tax=Chlamydomonas incerta TaxID=51695 RepID=A0A835VUC4_CHLIN|nr:hypothetical protein HXX76_013473 [Chlamydomonas incerta]|eukprot:KAG2425849.1 hypothetical protein HXX76_013473 [Chlamydomonas incerta]